MDTLLPATCVVQGLWIGDSRAARNIKFLGEADITTIINVSGFDDDAIADVDIYNFTVYDNELMDNEFDRMATKISSIVNSLKKARDAKEIVLVHDGRECVNRAPLVAAYYLVRDLGYTSLAAINTVRAANEQRDQAPRETVIYKDESGHETSETRCKYARTFTNKSFCKIIYNAKKYVA